MEKNYIIIRQLFGINNYLKMKTINKAYTTNVGKLINLALLNDDDILPEIQEHIDNIQSAIDKFDLQNDLLAFRGLSKLEFDMIDVGEQITKSFLQFKSTTLSNDVAKDFSSMSN